MQSNIRTILNDMESKREAGAKDFLGNIDSLRQEVVLAVAESGPLDPTTLDPLSARITSIVEANEPRLRDTFTQNQRNQFIKGIQLIDSAMNGAGITVMLPFLSEATLIQVQGYAAELITGISDDVRKRIVQEINLAVLGQKPNTEVLAAIGRNLTDPSVFGTVASRSAAIFRTEVNRIGNFAAVERMEQTRKQVDDLRKEWNHSGAGEPRLGHLDLDGTVIDVDELFTLKGADGQTYEVKQPHDPTLPASETVSCRCQAIPTVLRFQ